MGGGFGPHSFPMKGLLNSRSGLETIFHGHNDGTFTIQTRQDVQAILDDNQRRQTDGLTRDKELIPVANVPVNVYQKFLDRFGFTWENAHEPDVRRLFCQLYLNDIEFRKLRTTEGQI